jgi:hypothetical protein
MDVGGQDTTGGSRNISLFSIKWCSAIKDAGQGIFNREQAHGV